MKILDDLSASADPKRPLALAVGSFDGVHKGHQSLLRTMRNLVGTNGSVCVVTFSNHPSHVLQGKEPVDLILSADQKLRWLAHYGVDLTYCVPFTLQLSEVSYVDFLRGLYQACPFDHLVFGEGDRLGHRREGTPEKVRALCESMGVLPHYLEKAAIDGDVVSSQRIRALLRSGELEEAERLLGHPIASDKSFN